MAEAVRKIREAGVDAVGVVSRDGSVLAADLPAGVSRETFSIMCATIHGAGMTISNELRRSPPKRITLHVDEGTVVIAEVGRRALVVFVLAHGSDFDGLLPGIRPFLEEIANETG
ncbi:MAG: roadblock/LC7 domain-containing protein [Candidatus Thermoplasmatota archaeon]